MTILQIIPRAYINKLIGCNNHDMWTLIAKQPRTEYLGALSLYLVCFQLLRYLMRTDMKNMDASFLNRSRTSLLTFVLWGFKYQPATGV